MVGHGSRSCVKPSVSGGFWCVVCNNLVHTGDQVVGVRNVNNPGRNGWDHVHEGCAAEYVSPPLSSEVPSERADLPLDPARAPRSEEASSAAPLAEKVEEYIRLASTLQQEVATLTQQLRELKEVVASTSSITTTLQQEVATLTQQLQAEQTLRGAAERRAEEAGHETARLQGEALAAAAAEQAKAAAANEECVLLEQLMETQLEPDAESPAAPLSGRSVKRRVEGGERLDIDAVPRMGQNVLCEFLRAMGVAVGRDLQQDIPKLKERVVSELRKREVTQWSIDDQCRESHGKRRELSFGCGYKSRGQ